MAFFKREHKKLAKYNTVVLKDCYRQTEIGLRNATASGDEKAIKTAMKRDTANRGAKLTSAS